MRNFKVVTLIGFCIALGLLLAAVQAPLWLGAIAIALAVSVVVLVYRV